MSKLNFQHFSSDSIETFYEAKITEQKKAIVIYVKELRTESSQTYYSLNARKSFLIQSSPSQLL